MFYIVGHHIYLNRYDEIAFKVIYKLYDDTDHTYNFEPTDIITLNILDFNTGDKILSKVADNIKINDVDTHIIVFGSTDYKILSSENYMYEVIVDTSTGSTYKLIDKDSISIIGAPDSLRDSMDIELGRITDINSISYYLSDIPLICTFNQKKVNKSESDDGTLILFDKIESLPDNPDSDDGTLIIF